MIEFKVTIHDVENGEVFEAEAVLHDLELPNASDELHWAAFRMKMAEIMGQLWTHVNTGRNQARMSKAIISGEREKRMIEEGARRFDRANEMEDDDV